jgi:putative ABC transport system substrate-binding protein
VWVEAGLLLGYEPNLQAMSRRGAWHVARILSGSDPALLPIERPTTYELVVNRGTLAHLALTLPPPVEAQVTAWVSR